jgi:hypothetical protein
VDEAVLIHMLNLARVTPWVIPWAAIALIASGPTAVSTAAPALAGTS